MADAVGFLSGATIVSLDADTVALTVDAVVPALATAVIYILEPLLQPLP